MTQPPVLTLFTEQGDNCTAATKAKKSASAVVLQGGALVAPSLNFPHATSIKPIVIAVGRIGPLHQITGKFRLQCPRFIVPWVVGVVRQHPLQGGAVQNPDVGLVHPVPGCLLRGIVQRHGYRHQYSDYDEHREQLNQGKTRTTPEVRWQPETLRGCMCLCEYIDSSFRLAIIFQFSFMAPLAHKKAGYTTSREVQVSRYRPRITASLW